MRTISCCPIVDTACGMVGESDMMMFSVSDILQHSTLRQPHSRPGQQRPANRLTTEAGCSPPRSNPPPVMCTVRNINHRHRRLQGCAPPLANQIFVEHQIADRQNVLAGERVDDVFGNQPRKTGDSNEG